MGVIFILLIIIAFITLLLFAFDAKVSIVFDTERNDMHLAFLWLYPFLNVIGTMENTRPVLDFYFLKKHLFSKSLKLKRNTGNIKKTDLIKIIKAEAVSINTRYGFKNPSTTGITCGAVNAASQFINIKSLNHVPDFMAINDYIYLDAKASVNLGASLTNLIKFLKNRRNLQWIRQT
ncbi:MAG: hypothetical protein K0R50_4404 [Eubacterium sp.]|jgi:hypothetical protein|nr:hypothetical protein [Eubacterium sp.]